MVQLHVILFRSILSGNSVPVGSGVCNGIVETRQVFIADDPITLNCFHESLLLS